MNALLIAFSTYSALPMPQREWREQDLARVLCFLPLVGLLPGLLLPLWFYLARLWQLSPLLTAAGAAVLPVLITGGIHLDGFCDTMDALSSHQPPEKKRAILHDPRAGAFAVIACGCYLLLYAGLMSEIVTPAQAAALGASCVLSRACCALQVAHLRRYDDKGMLAAFSVPMDKRAVTASALLALAVTAAFLLWRGPLTALLMLAAAALLSLGFRRLVYAQFNGMSGDLAGWFIQTMELLLAAMIVIGGRL
ncbi:MAG: adenosylcobinamide-GDP ribazoletransferase [Firmicutes bacterium]|nr:adenosylcobinamide-GDP ribazoletransferase [Bacillota bacterium]